MKRRGGGRQFWGVREGGVFQSYFREFLLIVESWMIYFIYFFFSECAKLDSFMLSLLIRHKITGATRQQSLLLNAALIMPDKDFH